MQKYGYPGKMGLDFFVFFIYFSLTYSHTSSMHVRSLYLMGPIIHKLRAFPE
jgi:hypothetical protein